MNNNFIEVFIINFNGANTVLTTIESLYKSRDVEIKITVLDDHSTDDSPDLIKKHFPEISVIILPFNTKKANILRNKALKIAESKYIFITDNDLDFDENCLSELLQQIKSDDKIATCSPRLMYWDQPEKVYTAGTQVHYIGAAISEQRDKIFDESIAKVTSNSGGGICLIRREYAIEVGGFDENFFTAWGDDGEFFQRLLRAGYKCLYVPTAFALHENKIVDTIRKYRVVGQTYNRWLFILSHYSIPLIILATPVFFIYELMQAAFVLIKGVFPEYIKGNLLIFKNYKVFLEKRKAVQKIKKVSDKEALFSGNLYVAPALINKYSFLKYAILGLSSFFNFYWKLIKPLIP